MIKTPDNDQAWATRWNANHPVIAHVEIKTRLNGTVWLRISRDIPNDTLTSVIQIGDQIGVNKFKTAKKIATIIDGAMKLYGGMSYTTTMVR